MNEREASSRSAAAQMSYALARWEGDGGALARAARGNREDGADTPTTEAVFSDVAIQQGMILERRDDNGAAIASSLEVRPEHCSMTEVTSS